jgi:hypothetical protein
MMRKAFIVLITVSLAAWIAGCGSERKLPEQWKIPLVPAKGYKGPAKGMAEINTKTGTDIKVTVSGLEPKRVYTVYFINVKSKMFEGIGPSPHVLAVKAVLGELVKQKLPTLILEGKLR